MNGLAKLVLLFVPACVVWVFASAAPVTAPVPSPVVPALVTTAPVVQSGSWTGITGNPPSLDVPANQTLVIDLGGPGQGYDWTYDSARWLVILSFTRFTVGTGATVRFIDHPSHAPVVIRALEPIVIQGTIDLNGEAGYAPGNSRRYPTPGPGGFTGGYGTLPGSLSAAGGQGPGGGWVHPSNNQGGGASHTTTGGAPGVVARTYGVPSIHSLIGGSGGAGGKSATNACAGGGAGGGAILIGSDQSVQLSGRIEANGGVGGFAYDQSGGGGSGGMIRISSPQVSLGGGRLYCRGGPGNSWNYSGGKGRIQVDANTTPGAPAESDPPYDFRPLGVDFLPTLAPKIALWEWRTNSASPWNGITQDPRAELTAGSMPDVPLPSVGPFDIRIRGVAMPQGTTFYLRLTSTTGQVVETTHTLNVPDAVDPNIVWAVVPVNFTLGVSTVQVLAKL